MAFGRVERAIRSLPGFDAVDRYFCERYTGYPTSEVHLRGHYYSPLPDIDEARRIALRAFLQHNLAYDILLMNRWVHQHRQEFLREHMPVALKTPGSSLWLVKRR